MEDMHYFYLVWLAACFSNLSNNYISIDVPIHNWISFYSNKAMLLAMIEPMACASCSDYSLKLISFHPDDLFHALIPPKF